MIEDDAQGMLELARDGADILRELKPGDAEWEQRRKGFLEEVEQMGDHRFN